MLRGDDGHGHAIFLDRAGHDLRPSRTARSPRRPPPRICCRSGRIAQELGKRNRPIAGDRGPNSRAGRARSRRPRRNRCAPRPAIRHSGLRARPGQRPRARSAAQTHRSRRKSRESPRATRSRGTRCRRWRGPSWRPGARAAGRSGPSPTIVNKRPQLRRQLPLDSRHDGHQVLRPLLDVQPHDARHPQPAMCRPARPASAGIRCRWSARPRRCGPTAGASTAAAETADGRQPRTPTDEAASSEFTSVNSGLCGPSSECEVSTLGICSSRASQVAPYDSGVTMLEWQCTTS